MKHEQTNMSVLFKVRGLDGSYRNSKQAPLCWISPYNSNPIHKTVIVYTECFNYTIDLQIDNSLGDCGNTTVNVQNHFFPQLFLGNIKNPMFIMEKGLTHLSKQINTITYLDKILLKMYSNITQVTWLPYMSNMEQD